MVGVITFLFATQLMWTALVFLSYTRRMDIQGDFCEPAGSPVNIFNQLGNTASSLAYLVASNFVAIKVQDCTAGLLIYFIGISSMLYHGYMTDYGGMLDFGAILLYFSHRIASYARNPITLFVAILVVSWNLVYMTVPWVYSEEYGYDLPRVGVSSAIVVVLMITAMLGLEQYYHKQQWKRITVLLILLSASLSCWGVDRITTIWCDGGVSIGHILWHIFSAVTLAYFEWVRVF